MAGRSAEGYSRAHGEGKGRVFYGGRCQISRFQPDAGGVRSGGQRVGPFGGGSSNLSHSGTGLRDDWGSVLVRLGGKLSNMVAAAAGMATMGLVPILSIFACFCSKRTADQVSTSIAYPRLNVVLCGHMPD